MVKKSVAFTCLFFLFAVASARGQDQAAPAPVPAAAPAKAAEVNPAEIQWVWGEVVAVDPAEKSISLKYLDYDTDEEKTMKIMVADGTTFEDAKGIEGVKVSDTVSVEYGEQDGKNLAKVITVEKVDDVENGDQALTAPPEKVGSGPVSEVEGPVNPEPAKAEQAPPATEKPAQ